MEAKPPSARENLKIFTEESDVLKSFNVKWYSNLHKKQWSFAELLENSLKSKKFFKVLLFCHTLSKTSSEYISSISVHILTLIQSNSEQSENISNDNTKRW